MSAAIKDCEDVGEALREQRPLATAHAYQFQLAVEGVLFKPVQVADPVPTGRQVLTAAGLRPVEEFTLSAVLPAGDFEDVRLDETFDLRARGVERFIAFRTDREFKLTLDQRQLSWGKAVIPGSALYALAGAGDDIGIFLEIRGGEDRFIEPADLVDLTEAGIERFITAPKPEPGFLILVNAVEETVSSKQVTYEQVVKLAFPDAGNQPNVVYSMTYRNAASKPHAGELGAGGSVEVKKQGTIFNVTPTVQS